MLSLPAEGVLNVGIYFVGKELVFFFIILFFMRKEFVMTAGILLS